MNLSVNGTPKESQAETVTGLLAELGMDQPRGVAVAVNGAVVSKSQWNEHTLNDGDEIEIIRATQGG